MSSKEVKIRVTGDVSDLLKKLEMVKDSFDDLNKGNTNNNKSIRSLFDDLSDVDKKIEKTANSMDDLADATGKVGKKNITGIADDLSDTNKKIDNTVKGFNDLNKQINDVDTKPFDAIDKRIASLYETTNKVSDMFSDTFETFDEFDNLDNKKIKIDFIDNVDPDDFFDNITDGLIQGTIIGKSFGDTLTSSFGDASDELKELIKNQNKSKDYLEEEQELLKKNKIRDDFNKDFKKNIEDLDKAYEDVRKAVKNNDMDLLDETLIGKIYKNNKGEYEVEKSKLSKLRRNLKDAMDLVEYDKAPIEEQIKAYKQLEKESLKFISNEKNHVAIRKQVADNLKDARQAVIHLGAELDDLPKDVFDKLSDDLNKFTEESKNSTITTKKLGYELSNLDKSLSDKFVKNKINDDSFKRQYKQADEMAESFEKASKKIVNFANESEQAIKRFEVNGKVYEVVANGVEKFNESLDNKRLEERNNALKEYIDLLKETGNEINKKYLTDNGEFDISKYYEDYDKYGKPIAQLSMQFQSLRQKTLEYLQVEENSLEDKAKYIKMVNEQAKSLRKLGTAVEGIDLSDIESFDKSLASNLNNGFNDLFDNDIPGNIKETIDEIKAAFDELGNLELGKAFDLFGNAAKGFAKNILSKIPAQLKAAAVSVAGLSYATVKLYEIGKQQFFEGLTNIGNKLQPAINAIQSFGREAISAFEEITNTQLDLSSLMVVGPEFEYQMQRVGSIAGSNSKQLEKLTARAAKLGGTTQFTASQVGEAFEYMAMAGYSTEEMLASIDDTLNLAIISGGDLGTVSDIVTDGLTALGMSAADTGEFVDKLAATITSSNTTVELFGNTLKQVGALAGSLGIDMTDLSTAIGLSANAGIKGERAGTSLKNVLSNMASPTKEQAAALEKLGLTADETGSYLKTTADGNVDLAATMKSLMKATDGMTNTQKASILTQIAGKEAIAGLMSIMNQGEDAWDELSNTIENSTGKVQYWNECMSLAGKSGSEAVKLIDNMKQVFSEVESEAQAAGMSTEDLANAIALLGDDGKVTSDNVRDLIKVIDDMGTATGEQEEKWRALDKTGKSALNTNFNYDKSVAAITADTQGLTQAQKESMIAELGKAKTYKEAIDIAKKYSQGNIDMTKTIERVSLADYSYSERIKFLRDQLKGLSDEERKAALENLGLGNSFEEINEICDMSDKEFDAYTKNLETVQSMSDQLANAMDEVTKGSLLRLAAAIQNVAISAFNSFKPAIQNASNALKEFFDTWHNGDKNEFTFTGLENGLKGLEQKIRGAIPNIQQAVADLFSGIDRFVNGGSLDSILQIGTDVITGICNGISEAKENGSLDSAIDGAIKKICGWIEDNGPTIEQAGIDILDSIKTGIENNKDEINSALDVLCGVIESWAKSSAELESAANTLANRFIELAGKQIGLKLKTEGLKWLQIPAQFFNPDLGKDPNGSDDSPEKQNFKKQTSLGNILGNIWNKGKEWLLGESYAAEVGEKDGTAYTGGVKKGLLSNAPYKEVNEKQFKDTFNQNQQNGLLNSGAYMDKYNIGLNNGKATTDATAASIGDGISQGIMSKLESMDPSQLAGLEQQLISLQTTTESVAIGMGTSFTNIQNSARTSFMGLSNIVRNQMVNCANIVRNQAVNMSNIFRNQFVNMSNIVRNQAVNMANIMRNQMVNCANIVRNQCVNMANIFRNQFVSMSNVARNQMVNVSNIIRNQAVSWSNVIRNQVQNARNTMTSSFISMRNVARNQMVAISNIIRNQAVTWSNIIRNQAANMRSAMTSAFAGMAASARAGMANVLSVVRSYMAQIKAATSQQMTMHFQVSKTVTTTNVTKNITEGLNSTMRAISRSSSPLSAPQALSIGGYATSMSGTSALASNGSITLDVPLYLDGKEVARATAVYNEQELAKLAKRNNRKRGE